MLRHFDQSCNHDSSQWWLLLIYIFSFTIAPIGMEYLYVLVFLFLLKSINDMYACSVSLYWVKEIACVLHNCHHRHYQLQHNQRAGWSRKMPLLWSNHWQSLWLLLFVAGVSQLLPDEKKSLTSSQSRPPDRDITQKTHSSSEGWWGKSRRAESYFPRVYVRNRRQWPARSPKKSLPSPPQRFLAHAHTRRYKLRVRRHTLSYDPLD